MFNFFNKSNKTSELPYDTIAAKAINLSNEGVEWLTGNHSKLTNGGKFEALIFNMLICHFNLQTRLSPKGFEDWESDLYEYLEHQSKVLQVHKQISDIDDFTNQRFRIYAPEIKEILEGNGYALPGRTYKLFYLTPLVVANANNLPINVDGGDLISFKFPLNKMANQVLQSISHLNLGL